MNIAYPEDCTYALEDIEDIADIEVLADINKSFSKVKELCSSQHPFMMTLDITSDVVQSGKPLISV